ncbi:MAG: hypothetical protein HY040_01915, partial [Planctomycetes bacterium]|nr:hypothetical protein [Planctomycetota bacterium]
ELARRFGRHAIHADIMPNRSAWRNTVQKLYSVRKFRAEHYWCQDPFSYEKGPDTFSNVFNLRIVVACGYDRLFERGKFSEGPEAAPHVHERERMETHAHPALNQDKQQSDQDVERHTHGKRHAIALSGKPSEANDDQSDNDIQGESDDHGNSGDVGSLLANHRRRDVNDQGEAKPNDEEGVAA